VRASDLPSSLDDDRPIGGDGGGGGGGATCVIGAFYTFYQKEPLFGPFFHSKRKDLPLKTNPKFIKTRKGIFFIHKKVHINIYL